MDGVCTARLRSALWTCAIAIGMVGACARTQPGVFDRSAGVLSDWDSECRVYRPCEGMEPLRPCPQDAETRSAPSVTGRITFQPRECTLVACGQSPPRHCFNSCAQYLALLADDGTELNLPEMGCTGDESRVCCKIAVSEGQRVRVTFQNGFHICAL